MFFQLLVVRNTSNSDNLDKKCIKVVEVYEAFLSAEIFFWYYIKFPIKCQTIFQNVYRITYLCSQHRKSKFPSYDSEVRHPQTKQEPLRKPSHSVTFSLPTVNVSQEIHKTGNEQHMRWTKNTRRTITDTNEHSASSKYAACYRMK